MNKLEKMLNVLIKPSLFISLITTGVAASVEHQKLIAVLRPRSVVDIGANRGQFALLCRNLFPDIPIFSFEPLPEAAKTFRAVFRGDPKTRLFECAIGAKPGTGEIHVSKEDDSSSLLPITRQAELFPGTDEKETRKIVIKRLDELLDETDLVQPALLKIDVQGYELEVLKGCGGLLEAFAYVYVECSFEELYDGQALASEVIDFLHNRGFALNGIYNLYYHRVSGMAIQGDFLFINKR